MNPKKLNPKPKPKPKKELLNFFLTASCARGVAASSGVKPEIRRQRRDTFEV